MMTKLFTRNLSFIRYSILVFMVFLMASPTGYGQANWRKKGDNKSATFYEVQNDFNQHWNDRTVKKGQGYKVFKRWENYMAPRVYPSGNMILPSTNYENYQAWLKHNPPSAQRSTANWTAVGPMTKPLGYDAGVGRVDFVRFDPTNTDIMYVGTPDGGLWKSNNGGAFWTTNTDFLTVIGCSDLAIDPTNTQIMYLATGNWETDRRSIGILKSTDGGDTWNTTSLTWTALDNYKIRKLVMDPTNPMIMMVATDGGVFRTTDGWATNEITYCCSGLYDIKFKPGNPNAVYAAGTEFWMSEDNGVNWEQITDGLPDPDDVSRMVLGVTAADDKVVYVLAGDIEDGFLGLYLSTDSGVSFGLQSDSPNILNASKDGSGTGGQASHDLAIAISPIDADLVTIGGINQWRSTDGGVEWDLLTYWLGDDVTYPGQGDGPPDYIHADIQSIEYLPGSSTIMFATCDGGISKSTNGGQNWSDISHNLSIAQQTCVGLSSSDPGIIVTGLQDIGSLKAEGGAWTVINGGDGEDAFIDRTNNLVIVSSNPNGAHAISFDGGTNYENIDGLPEDAQWFSPISQDPVDAELVYAGGRTALWYTLDLFTVGAQCDWVELGTPDGTGNILQFAIAESDHDIIYAIKQDAVSVSYDGGSSWADQTGDLPIGNGALTDVAVSNTNADIVWVTFSGYSDVDKVFKSTDGGDTWTNYSDGLPNLPINTVVAVNGSADDAVYIGADLGIYYRDNSLNAFEAYNTSLPNVAVTDLEIYYPGNLLRASTYGRGTWESSLYETPVVSCPENVDVCDGSGTFDLTGGTPEGGTYSGPGVSGGIFDPAVAGTGSHTIVYQNGTTCTFTITVHALPVVTCAMNDTVIVNDPEFNLTGAMPAGGMYTGTGVDAGAFDPATAGEGTHIITYTFTDVQGCLNSCTYMITVDSLNTSLFDVDNNLFFTVTPNPTSGQLNIQLSMLQSMDAQIHVTNSLGQVVMNRVVDLSAGANQIGLDMQTLTSGVYFIRISAGNQSGIFQVRKE